MAVNNEMSEADEAWLAIRATMLNVRQDQLTGSPAETLERLVEWLEKLAALAQQGYLPSELTRSYNNHIIERVRGKRT